MTTFNKKVQNLSVTPHLDNFSIVGAVLRNQTQFFEEIRQGIDLPEKITKLFIAIITFLTIYGAVLGSGHPFQALSAALKLPLVFFGSVVACLPTLYIFDIFLGSKRSLSQTLAVLFTATTTAAVLLFSFAPITIVFRLTSNGYQFFSILNVGFLLVTTTIGIFTLERGLRHTTHDGKTGIFSEAIYVIWIFIFLLVGGQLAWGLRPFFHYPGTEFTLWVGNGNLITQFGQAMGEFLGFWVVR